MCKEEILRFQAAMQKFAEEQLINAGFTGKEFFFENLTTPKGADSKKSTMNIGLEDTVHHVFHADPIRFGTVDFSAKSVVRLFMSDKLFEQLPSKPDYTTVIKSSGWAKVTDSSPDTLLTFAKEAFVIALQQYKPTEVFGCCSKYEACSDAGRCLHAYQLYAKGCQYWENLEAGKRFYGKQKNV